MISTQILVHVQGQNVGLRLICSRCPGHSSAAGHCLATWNSHEISETFQRKWRLKQHSMRIFFLPWYLGRWRCLMVRISPFTSIGHQKKTRGLTQQTLFFYSFYLCFYHEVLEFLLIFENTNSKRVSTPESKTHGTVEFSTTWNSLSNCMGSDSTGWKRTDFLTNNAGGLEIFTRPGK